MTGCYLDRAGMSSSNPPRNWEAFRFVWDWRLFRSKEKRVGVHPFLTYWRVQTRITAAKDAGLIRTHEDPEQGNLYLRVDYDELLHAYMRTTGASSPADGWLSPAPTIGTQLSADVALDVLDAASAPATETKVVEARRETPAPRPLHLSPRLGQRCKGPWPAVQGALARGATLTFLKTP